MAEFRQHGVMLDIAWGEATEYLPTLLEGLAPEIREGEGEDEVERSAAALDAAVTELAERQQSAGCSG